ncbi:hypothetical protein [Streptomyces sp. DT117]|uniref:hypothetical protein n=1 Tax=Streptomyces sp. DT117 TaxID=3393422 RepID=UPI003CED826D
MTESAIVADLRRELEKAWLALDAAQRHLTAHAQMNAALHCAEQVFHSPLHAKVTAALQGIDHALNRTKPAVPLSELSQQHSDAHCLWRTILGDLDRCQHGRHQGDACGPADDCTGISAGNPHLRPGAVIGYGLRRDVIVMPDPDHKHDVNAWRQPAGDA